MKHESTIPASLSLSLSLYLMDDLDAKFDVVFDVDEELPLDDDVEPLAMMNTDDVVDIEAFRQGTAAQPGWRDHACVLSAPRQQHTCGKIYI